MRVNSLNRTISFGTTSRLYKTKSGDDMGCNSWLFRNDIDWNKLAKYEIAIRTTITSPIQNPEKFPDTIPDRMVKEAPPSLEAVTTSHVCFALGLVNTFVNSGIKAAPRVPQLIIIDKVSHKLFGIEPNKYLLTPKVMQIDNIEVNQTRFVKGASKSNSGLFANKILFKSPFTA